LIHKPICAMCSRRLSPRHPMNRIDELLPFAYLPAQAEKAVA
jgi:hypothetical protein